MLLTRLLGSVPSLTAERQRARPRSSEPRAGSCQGRSVCHVALELSVSLSLSVPLPSFFVTMMTPLEAREPYMEEALASFSTWMEPIDPTSRLPKSSYREAGTPSMIYRGLV